MRLSIVTAICGALDITRQWFDETIGNCTTKPDVLLVSNGNTRQEEKELEDLCLKWSLSGKVGTAYVCSRFDEPVGSTKAFNAAVTGYQGIHPDNIVAMLHNDLMVREKGWDDRVLSWYSIPHMAHEIGVCGFHGSRALGDPNLYRIPYELHQLARGDNFSNMEDAEHHGVRVDHPVEVVTCDGMALIARCGDLREWGGLDERLKHHCYDHDLCLTARRFGRHNFMLPVRVRHISGQTANAPRYNEQMRKLGYVAGDVDIHAESHRLFYEKWRHSGQLPARLP